MRRCVQTILACSLLVGLASLVGCGPDMPADRPKAEVSGTVTFDGAPLPEGEITFSKVAEGVGDTLPIKDGKFLGQVSVGDRKVEIRAYRESKAATSMYGDDAPVSKENYLPAKYHTDSTFKADIPAAGAKDLTFAVTAK